MNSTFNETAMNSILQYIVALLGNPGTGKSTLGNCIAGKNDDGSLPFESGLSYGTGKIVRNPVSRGHRRIVDLPGFADVDKTRNTGLEIADIINKELFIGEAFVKLIFVVDLKYGRVMPEDLATMVTILTAVQEALHDKTVEVKYSVIVNQVKKKQFRELRDRNGDAFRKVYASLQIDGFGTQNILILPEVEALSEEENAVVPMDDLPELDTFIENAPGIQMSRGTQIMIDASKEKLEELHRKLQQSDQALDALVSELRHLKTETIATKGKEEGFDWKAAIAVMTPLIIAGAKVGLEFMNARQQREFLQKSQGSPIPSPRIHEIDDDKSEDIDWEWELRKLVL